MPNGTHIGLVSDYDDEDRREKRKKLKRLRAQIADAEKVVEAVLDNHGYAASHERVLRRLVSAARNYRSRWHEDGGEE